MEIFYVKIANMVKRNFKATSFDCQVVETDDQPRPGLGLPYGFHDGL
jgi:hypothetical protein